MKTSRAPCSNCLGETEHNVLLFVDRNSERVDWWHYTLLECAGCKHIVLREELSIGDRENDVLRYYPSPTTRKVPDWVYDMSIGLRGGQSATPLGDLFLEIYQAV